MIRGTVLWFIAFWRILFVVGVTGEMVAFLNSGPDDTLSERVVRWQHAIPVLRFLLCGFLIWLTIHFATGQLRDGRVVFVWSGRELLAIWLASLTAYFAWVWIVKGSWAF